ncbi:AraC family transcriptional regulator [Aquabacterium sp.]|uniref:AraC family transcriptional regulator n=1 Tax=Aquabacterium sp. TaxID=1872578 RepID=UPI002487AE65|nr:AraC family transcriptional regulator [Aquabacterium sp.]MDI1260198.1 AraC family transcriptional regulator [Aquabacterium sp.]
MHATSSINPVAIRHIIEEIRHRDKNPDELCRNMGLTTGGFESPDLKLSCRQIESLVRRAIRMVPDPHLGHQVGCMRNIVDSGLMGLAIATSKSLRQFLELVPSYPGALGSPLSICLEHAEDGTLCLVAKADHEDLSVAAFFIDELFTSLLQLLRSALGKNITPQFLDFSYSKPEHEDALHKFFQAPIQFGQNTNRLAIAADWLDVELPTADAVVFTHVTELLKRELAEFQQFDICQTIERVISGRLESPPKLTEVAASLGTSERTLRRQLAQMGMSYQTLTDKVYKSKAVEFLQSSDASVADVATSLGFSDVRNFRRAFKRWTGVAPTSCRK